MAAKKLIKLSPNIILLLEKSQFPSSWSCNTKLLAHTTRETSLPLSSFCLAVSSSPRLWMGVFALPAKSNMAVTKSDPDHKFRKMSITFYWLSDLWAEHAGMKLKCYWFKKNIFDLIMPRYDSPKKCPMILYAVNLWLKPVLATGAVSVSTMQSS